MVIGRVECFGPSRAECNSNATRTQPPLLRGGVQTAAYPDQSPLTTPARYVGTVRAGCHRYAQVCVSGRRWRKTQHGSGCCSCTVGFCSILHSSTRMKEGKRGPCFPCLNPIDGRGTAFHPSSRLWPSPSLFSPAPSAGNRRTNVTTRNDRSTDGGTDERNRPGVSTSLRPSFLAPVCSV